MAGANFRRQSVDKRAIAFWVHHLGDLAELLQPSKDRMAAVANLDQTADVGMHPFRRYPASRRLIERFSLDKREMGQPSPIAFGGLRIADWSTAGPGADLIVEKVACGAGLDRPCPKSDQSHAPWNKGCPIGQKRPLRPKEVRAIRVRLQIKQTCSLAMFNLAIGSKLRAWDLVSLRGRGQRRRRSCEGLSNDRPAQDKPAGPV
jgi:hypothetical protein